MPPKTETKYNTWTVTREIDVAGFVDDPDWVATAPTTLVDGAGNAVTTFQTPNRPGRPASARS